jgi:hypothetical protein
MMTQLTLSEQIARIDQAIAGQETLRGTMPDAFIEENIGRLQAQKAALQGQPSGGQTAVGSTYNAPITAQGDVVGGHKAGGDIVGGDKTSVTVGDVSGGRIAIAGRLSHTIQQAPALDQAAKTELDSLLHQLQTALAGLPAAHQDEAEAVAEMAQDLVEKAARPDPNRRTITITAEGLQKAAENLKAITPTVLTIAAQIAATISRALPV